MANKVRPIGPDEAKALHAASIPDDVFEVINELLVKDVSSGRIVVHVDTVMRMLQARGVQTEKAFSHNWFDVEPMYSAVGWKVTYNHSDNGSPGGGSFSFEERKSQ